LLPQSIEKCVRVKELGEIQWVSPLSFEEDVRLSLLFPNTESQCLGHQRAEVHHWVIWPLPQGIP
jgi:hypothetical protein